MYGSLKKSFLSRPTVVRMLKHTSRRSPRARMRSELFFCTNFQMLIGGYSHHYDKVGTVLGGHLKNTDGRGFSTEKMKVWHVCRWSVCKRPDAQILDGKKCVPRHSTLSRTFSNKVQRRMTLVIGPVASWMFVMFVSV